MNALPESSSAEYRIGTTTARGLLEPGEDAPGIQRYIDNQTRPALTVPDGSTVVFECPGMPLPPGASLEHLAVIDPERPHAVVGPVYVEGAEPGDTLIVDIIDVSLAQNYGHTLFLPGHGLLPDDFSMPYIHNWSWEPGATHAELKPGISIPIHPFCGFLGTSPAEPGEHPTLPPRHTGGNLDLRHLVPGTRLYLPVEVPGALFYCGDGHAAQGDGEVCLTAIETGVHATIHLSLERGTRRTAPEFRTPGPLSVPSPRAGYHAMSAAGPDIYASSQEVIRRMIGYLTSEHGLSREEAYVLCSVVCDLKINEIVDAPNWVVTAYLPLDIFDDER
ncbi:MAG: acetamidase/formamidase family protein [Tessaracoccus sp.]